MEPEELLPRRIRGYEMGADLSMLSLEELKELVSDLRAEIARIEAEVAAKESTRSAADSLFKS